jgi:hypothetical protein
VHKLLSILAFVVLASCQQAPQAEFHGRLYFASGNYVGEFDLAQGTSVAVANRGDVTIRNVSEFDPGRLLLTEMGTVDGRDAPRISWLDLDSGEAGSLFAGVIARYLPVPAALVWDDGQRLHASPRRRNSSVNAEITAHNLNQLATIIDVSDSAVLFEVGLPEKRVIESYDVNTRERLQREQLSAVCRLAGAVWINDLEVLACPAKGQIGDYPEYLLADIDGNIRGRLALPEGKHFVALDYAPDQQALFLTERWVSPLGGGERFAVWAYDFIDGQSYRIVRNQYLGDSAVYVAD